MKAIFDTYSLYSIIRGKQMMNLATGLLISLALLFAKSVMAAKSVDWNVQTMMSINTEFMLSSDGDYGYEKADYIHYGSESDNYDLSRYFHRLTEENEGGLPESTLIPILNGDITIFIPYSKMGKALGDTFVQTRYIRDQVTELLGRHLIDAYAIGDEQAQLTYLYNNTFTFSFQEGTQFGTPLTQEQKENLALDIIWPEFHIVNGEKLLVPVVYLSDDTYSERRVQGNVTEFEGLVGFDKITIESGDLELRREAFINISGSLTVEEGASLITKNEHQIVVGGTLKNYGKILADGNLDILAENIKHQTKVYHYVDRFGRGERLGEIATIQANGDVRLATYRDMPPSTDSTEDMLPNSIQVIGGEIEADGSIIVGNAGRFILKNINLAHDTRFENNGRSGRWSKQSESSTNYFATKLSAPDQIQLMSGLVNIEGGEFYTAGAIDIMGQYGVHISNGLREYSRVRIDDKGEDKKFISEYLTIATRAALNAGESITIASEKGNIHIQGTNFRYADELHLSAKKGSIRLALAVERDSYRLNSVDNNIFRTKITEKGHDIDRGSYNEIVGGIRVDAQEVYIEYEPLSDLKFSDQVARLAAMKNVNWIRDIQENSTTGNIVLEEADLMFKRWKDVDRHLSEEMIALIAIVVAVATNGQGSELAGAAATTTYAAITDAAFTVLITQIATLQAEAALNGRLLETDEIWDELRSDENTTQLLNSIVTAGFIASLPAVHKDFLQIVEEGDLAQDVGVKIGLMDQAYQAVKKATVRSAISTIVRGGDLQEIDSHVLKDALTQFAIDTLGEHMVEVIGESFKGDDLSAFERGLKYVSYAGAGCILGAASGSLDDANMENEADNCAAGAVGSVTGVIASEVYQEIETFLSDEIASVRELADSEISKGQMKYIVALNRDRYRQFAVRYQQKGVNLSKLSAALAVFIAHGNPDIGSYTGEISSSKEMAMAASEVAVELFDALSRAIEQHERNAKMSVRAELTERNKIRFNSKLLMIAELMGNIIDLDNVHWDENGTPFIKLGDGTRIYDEEAILEYLEQDAELKGKLFDLEEQHAAFEDGVEQHQAHIKGILFDGLIEALERQIEVEDRINVSGRGTAEGDTEQSIAPHREEFVVAIEELVGKFGNIILLGVPKLLASISGERYETDYLDDKQAKARTLLVTRLEEAGIEKADELLSDATYVAELGLALREVKEIVKFAVDGLNVLRRELRDFRGDSGSDELVENSDWDRELEQKYRDAKPDNVNEDGSIHYGEEFFEVVVPGGGLTGPVLPANVAKTFTDGVYSNRQLTEVTEFFKYHGVDNRTGRKISWLTNKRYSSETELRADLAIREDWGVNITSVSTFRVPKGTWVSEGSAAAQGEGYAGGGYQAVISNLARSWVTRTDKAFGL